MNLSQRLDEARRLRDEGGAPPVRPTLRAAKETPMYDGSDVRTGEAISEEEWRDRLRERHGGHEPRRRRTEPEERPRSWTLDLTGPEARIELEE